MVFSLTTQNKSVQPINYGNLISIGSVQANAFNGAQTGVPQPQLASFSVAPLAASFNNLYDFGIPASFSYIPITAGSGITPVFNVYNSYTNTNETVYFFDTPRALSIALAGALSSVVLTIWGFDQDNVFMTEEINVIGNIPVFSKKAFAGVTRIWVNNAPTSPLSIGTSDIIGLPYCLVDKTRIITNSFAADAAITSGITTLVSGISPAIPTIAVTPNSMLLLSRLFTGASTQIGNLLPVNYINHVSFKVISLDSVGATAAGDKSQVCWSIVNGTQGTPVKADTATATATTGDVRGTVTLPIPSNGVYNLQFNYLLADTTIGVSNQNYQTVYGVPQYAAPYK